MSDVHATLPTQSLPQPQRVSAETDFFVPRRAQTFDQAQQIPLHYRLLSPLVGRNPAPNRQEYRELILGLSQGDTLMDAYVDWMFTHNPRLGKEKFNQALHRGIDSVQDCPEPLRKLFVHLDVTPEWVDRARIEDAATFMRSSGMNAVYALRDFALMGGYLLSGFNHALIMTGALNKDAAKRFAETSKWWMDCTEAEGMQRFSSGWKSTIHVRFIHALVRRNLAANPKWKTEDWGLPLCQIDMAATIYGFGIVFLSGLRAMGVMPTIHESQSVMHFWKYVGWLIGVDERWLSDSERQGALILYHTLITQSSPDWTSQALGKSLSLEPFSRQYKHFAAIRRRFDYQKHMSVTSLFLTRRKMAELGLSKRIVPWFPLMIAPLNALGANVPRLLPKLRNMLEKRGRKEQVAFMATFGQAGLNVIQPAHDHPAHVE